MSKSSEPTRRVRRAKPIRIRVYKAVPTRYFALEVNDLNYGNYAMHSTAANMARFIAGALLDLMEAGTLPRRKVDVDIQR